MPGRDGRLVLAVDLGSSGVKVGVATVLGEVLHWTYRPLTTDLGPGGAATQDAEEWWRCVVDAARQCLAEGPGAGARVAAVGVTGQWASTVPVDAAGRPVGACLMWSDTRGAPYSRGVVGGRVQGYNARALATWVRRTAGIPSTSGADPVGHLLHLRYGDPQTARAARWFLEPVDHLAMRFTGVPAASPASMTAAWLTDNRHPELLAYDPVLVDRAGVDGDKLPPLMPTGTVIGPVTPAVADELGIAPTAAVVTGLPDLHSSAVGSGCVREREAHLSIGTTAWVSCPLPRKHTDLVRQMATVPGIGPEPYLLGNNQETAGRCLQWLRDVQPGAPSYDELVALAATAPPGSGGVLFTPWLAGERSPVDDRAARGGFHNLSLSTTRADLVRAVLEGVAYNARWLLEGADHVAGGRLTPVRVVGGGAQSLLWCQVLADVWGRPVGRVADPLLTGVRGTALAAGRALGALAWDDIRDLVPVDAHLEPRAVEAATYARLFAEFPGLYKRQRRMFTRLNSRAGTSSPPGRRTHA
ncbi:MAG TPA: FGGY-family carbohydrate kinase [Nocardioides sp.]|nr:FGGY-family carbohydrate kinase [Nocardioides sp.]